MLEKYRATIHGDKIEWDDDVPQSVRGKKSITVDVTLVSNRRRLERSDGKKMAAILNKLAAVGGVVSIKDPVTWQQNIRKDRMLPGRK